MRHITITDFTKVRSGAASAEEAAVIGRHVAACAVCAAEADRLLAVPSTVSAFEAAFALDDVTEHPDEEEIAAFADSSLDAEKEEEIAGHLQICAACANDVSDLRLMVRPRQSRRWLIAGSVAAAAVAILSMLNTADDQPVIRRGTSPDPVPPALAQPSVPAPLPDKKQSERPAEWDALVTRARKTGVLEFPPDIRDLGRPDSFRSSETGLVVSNEIWPTATSVDTQRPGLRWEPVAGARYTVTLTSAGRVIARSEALEQTRWRVPVTLERGRLYRWQVSAESDAGSVVLPAPPAPPAIFRVISDRDHQELSRALDQYPTDALLLGLIYARAGMVDEARQQLETHARTSQEPLARSLLEQLPASQ